MKLIVGLGNPGREYNKTRHNVGFMVVDKYLKKIGNPKLKEKFGGMYYEYFCNNEKIIILKPQEYINLSGMVVKKYVDYYNITVDDILIVNDDLDLQVGNYKLKPSGSSGGHNGLKNLELNLGTKDYKRLKIGISNDKSINTADYVLGKFDIVDLEKLDVVIDICVNILNDYIYMSFSDLMNKYNKKQ